MRVLVYGNRKQDDVIYDVSTPEKEAAAFLLLFKMLDEDWEVYTDLDDVEELKKCEPCSKGIHRLCEGECDCKDTPECQKKTARRFRTHSRQLQEKGLLQKARAGDAAAAKQLLTNRRTYEYEAFSYKDVLDPLKEK